MTPLETALTEIEKRAKAAHVREGDFLLVSGYCFEDAQADIERLCAALRVLLQAYDDADENSHTKNAVEAQIVALLAGDAP